MNVAAAPGEAGDHLAACPVERDRIRCPLHKGLECWVRNVIRTIAGTTVTFPACDNQGDPKELRRLLAASAPHGPQQSGDPGPEASSASPSRKPPATPAPSASGQGNGAQSAPASHGNPPQSHERAHARITDREPGDVDDRESTSADFEVGHFKACLYDRALQLLAADPDHWLLPQALELELARFANHRDADRPRWLTEPAADEAIREAAETALTEFRTRALGREAAVIEIQRHEVAIAGTSGFETVTEYLKKAALRRERKSLVSGAFRAGDERQNYLGLRSYPLPRARRFVLRAAMRTSAGRLHGPGAQRPGGRSTV